MFCGMNLLLANDLFKGFVVDVNNTPIPNANVTIENTSIGSVTDKEGVFIFENLDSTAYNIHISYIGYKDYEGKIAPGVDNMIYITLINEPINYHSIAVTASKTPQYIKDAPYLTHIISKEDIANSSYSTLQDMMQDALPNVQTVASNHTGNRVKIQGLDNRYILFLIDGDRVVGEYAGNTDFSMFNLADVERIEVVENSLSSLYGSNAIGGVVNVITKQNENKFWTNLSFFNDEYLITTHNFSFGGNKGKIYYNLNYIGKDSDGFDLTPNTIEKTIKESQDKTYSFRCLLEINENKKIDFSYKDYYSRIDKYHEISDVSGNALVALDPPLNRYTDDAFKIKYSNELFNDGFLKFVVSKEEYDKYYYYPYYYNSSIQDISINSEEFLQGSLNNHSFYLQYNKQINKNNFLFGFDYSKDE